MTGRPPIGRAALDLQSREICSVLKLDSRTSILLPAAWVVALWLAPLLVQRVILAQAADPEEAAQRAVAARYGTAKLTLNDGDRVVLLGGAFIEREQTYGYFEAALVSRFPGKKAVVRNLGRSGDTVWADSWSQSDDQADGLETLRKALNVCRPTVILAAYGNNEAFAGPAGSERFASGLQSLVDMLTATKARVVLLSPLDHENFGPPLPDPAQYNQHLQLYSNAIAALARERGLQYVDILHTISWAENSPAVRHRRWHALHRGRLLAGRVQDSGRAGIRRYAMAGFPGGDETRHFQSGDRDRHRAHA